MSKIIQISATQGADSTPIVYALFDDGTVKIYTYQYGWEDVRPVPKPKEDINE